MSDGAPTEDSRDHHAGVPRDVPVDDFRFIQPIEVRFGDTDAMGHVNNAVYLTYFEAARVGYWRAVTGSPFETPAAGRVSMILARAVVDYRAPAFFGETLLVACRATWLGRSSFGMAYRVVADEASPRGAGRLVAEGTSVQVRWDYEHGRAVAIDAELRRQLEAFEGAPIPSREAVAEPRG